MMMRGDRRIESLVCDLGSVVVALAERFGLGRGSFCLLLYWGDLTDFNAGKIDCTVWPASGTTVATVVPVAGARLLRGPASGVTVVAPSSIVVASPRLTHWSPGTSIRV